MLPPNSANGFHPPEPEKTKSQPFVRPGTSRGEAGCPTGCGCSGFIVALVLWTPALLVARAGGVGAGAIGITVLVSLFLDVFLLLGARLSLSGVSKEDRKNHLKPHILFVATYAITFLALLVATFFISRAHS